MRNDEHPPCIGATECQEALLSGDLIGIGQRNSEATPARDSGFLKGDLVHAKILTRLVRVPLEVPAEI